jgi:hypothetical protein
MALATADKNKLWNVVIQGQNRVAAWDPVTQNWLQNWGGNTGRNVIDPATQEGAEFTNYAGIS